MNLKEALRGVLTDEELMIVSRSFDCVGDIAVIEIPRELKKKEKDIAQKLLELHKNIKVVVKKEGSHEGTFRVQKLKILAGEKRKETIHTENGVRLKLNVEQVYFSSRQATERLRVASLVKPKESVLVLFSGCGPFCFVISKHSKAKDVTGVEKNPIGHQYAMENIKLNKTTNVYFFCGDAKSFPQKLNKRFDRIIMPLPKSAYKFLPFVFAVAKKGATIHLYDFQKEADIPNKSIDRVQKACSKADKKFKILNVVKCGQLSPRAYRVCVDFIVY